LSDHQLEATLDRRVNYGLKRRRGHDASSA
jgi:hypothetical protein